MWSLHHKGKFLEPLCFSNGKTQSKIVEEVLAAIKEGYKTIFIHGVCGTGKSAIALNIARKLGKTAVVVPIKNLQLQYKKDYEAEKYLLKENGERLKISIITGRNNHKCKFIADNQIIKINSNDAAREKNANLVDIFSGKILQNKKRENDFSADNPNIPCKIDIKERNWNQIKEFLNQNKRINPKSFNDIKDVKRFSVAGACPYWSPVSPEEYELNFENPKKRTYTGLNGKRFTFYQNKLGCGFYSQFNDYIDADVLVFNSLKYKLETLLNRKPKTEVDIIDECDEFLDSFSNQKTINIDRLQNSLNQIFGVSKGAELEVINILKCIKNIKEDNTLQKIANSGEIVLAKQTPIYDLLKIITCDTHLMYEVDDENYLLDVGETAWTFEELLNETYAGAEKQDKTFIISLVTTNLEKRFEELRQKNKTLVLMSGTLHSELVLSNIFGIKEYKIIEAETQQQGSIEILRTGLEKDCKYENFVTGKNSRKEYLEVLNKCVEISKKPTLVHVNAFQDLPSEKEIEGLRLNHLISKEKLIEMQNEDQNGKLIENFKKGLLKILFSTRCSRGIDFPNKECNSIIFTKYPNPNMQEAFWKILKQTKPKDYWQFYKDKARRELLQKIYRGLRSKNDHVFLLSPDERVLKEFEEKKD